MQTGCKLFAKGALGLHLKRNTVSCPGAPVQPTKILEFLPETVATTVWPNSWFNFWCMPFTAVLSKSPCESRKGLDRALIMVEDEIEKLMRQGICSEDIVVSGMSQGGVMTIWTALHSKYKLGGFIPIVTWAPLRNVYDYPKNSVNKNTPMLYFNGLQDPIVPVIPSFLKTKETLNEIFTNFESKLGVGTHLTTNINPLNVPRFSKWLCRNTNLQFSAVHPMANIAKVANGGFCKSGSANKNGFKCGLTGSGSLIGNAFKSGFSGLSSFFG